MVSSCRDTDLIYSIKQRIKHETISHQKIQNEK